MRVVHGALMSPNTTSFKTSYWWENVEKVWSR